MCFFGICPHNYNHISQTIDCSNFRLFYSIVYFLLTSVTSDYMLAVFFSQKIFTIGVVTYEIAKIIENVARSLIHNSSMIDLLLRRKSYAKFVNKLNEFQRSIESELDCKVNTRRENFRCMGIIVLFIAYLAISVAVYYTISKTYIHGALIFWFSVGFLRHVSITLVGVDVCNWNTILLYRFECLFEITDSLIEKFSAEETTNENDDTVKRLLKCFEKLEELNDIKLHFSDLFGNQILVIVSYNFVVMTMAFYFVLFPLIFVQSQDLFGILHFVMLNSPNLVVLCWMVVIMDKLGQQVRVTA